MAACRVNPKAVTCNLPAMNVKRHPASNASASTSWPFNWLSLCHGPYRWDGSGGQPGSEMPSRSNTAPGVMLSTVRSTPLATMDCSVNIKSTAVISPTSPHSSASCDSYANLIKVTQQVEWVLVNAVSTGSFQLILPVTAGQKTHT